MAEYIVRRQVDDLEHQRGNLEVPAEEEVVFGLDGRSYRIDLSTENAKELRDRLAEYISAARPLLDLEARTELSPAQAKKAELNDVRQWARAQGMQVNERGKIPKTVKDAYQAANGPLRHQ